MRTFILHIDRNISTKVLFLFAVLISISGCGNGLKHPEVSLGPDSSFADTAALEREHLDPDKVGYILYDSISGTVIMSHNRKKAFIPASTTKVVTAVSALKTLGTDYRFKTILARTGRIKSGTLYGDLYLKGTGDPHLKMEDLAGFVEDLHRRGIRKIQGTFYYDESETPSVPVIDCQMDADASYNPGISSLSCDYNRLFAQWKQNTENGDTSLYLIPSLPMNHVKMSGENPERDIRFTYTKSRGKGTWIMSRPQRKQGRESLPVKNPGLYTAQMFSRLCAIRGINTGRPAPGTIPDSCRIINVHQGEPLQHLLDLMLTYSNNMMSELILCETAQHLARRPQCISEAAVTVHEHICALIPGIDWKGFRMVNGSGLTSKNRITPEQLCAVLVYADLMMPEDLSFMSFLPVSGWEWSLMTRLNSPETAFRVYAKTGTIFYAVSLAGYMFTHSGRRLIFAFFITDPEKRASFEHDHRQGDRNTEKIAEKWVENARDSMDRIISGWVSRL